VPARIRIVSDSPGERLITCLVSEYSDSELVRVARCEGTYDLCMPDTAILLMISPLDGHWARAVEYNPSVLEIRCTPIEGDLCDPWWQRVVVSRSNGGKSASRLRIGIIDLLFERPPELRHVNFVDPDDWQRFLIERIAGKQLHGQRVSAILAARGPGSFGGLASDAEVFFVDASYVENKRVTGVDVARVVDGIRALSNIHHVDIINISSGFGQHVLPDLQDRIDEAADVGTLCICAGGNSGGNPVETPANLRTTIGVGGLGFTGVAPADSVMGELADDAINDRLLGTRHRGWPGHPFHDRRTSEGQGIDVCAPSVGVVLRSGEQISDLSGTSFASPIVVGVLACDLSKDDSYFFLEGRERYDYARKKLAAITWAVGLDPKKVGKGIPVLT
jgi:subtilisin family serine protease